MCGISGIVNFSQEPVNEIPIRAMMRCMKHRGPDDEGVFLEGQIGLGFVRLSIIDLSTAGHQPMYSADRRYVLLFNGEIFNYIELREELKKAGYVFRTQTDTEVLLTAYQAWGKDMLHRLNGMWAFVLFDRQEQTLFGARDRYGIKPLYYYLDDKRLAFASEIPPLLEVMGRKPHPNLSAVFNYLAFNRTDQANYTFFEEVWRVGHGCCFLLDLKQGHPGSLKTEKWYGLRNEIKGPFESPRDFRKLFSSSVGLRLRSDVPVGVCLSGGLDSSSIVSVLLNDFQKKGLNTFSAVYGKGVWGDESPFIDLFRKDLKNMYAIFPDEKALMADIEPFIQAHAEPIPTTSPYAQFKVMELAKAHVTVTLDGQGADEILAGYHYFFGFYFKNLLLSGKIGKLGCQMYKYFARHNSMLGINSFLFFLLPARMRIQAMSRRKDYLNRDFSEAYSGADMSIAGTLYGSSSLREALINHFEHKLEHLLKWEDRNSMWFSLEARVPFLDHRLVERTLATSAELILKNGETKRLLRQAMAGSLPEPIRQRQDKLGFETPQGEWFRSPAFRQYIHQLIHSPSFTSRGYMDMKKVLNIYHKHMSREGNYSNEIWKWIHLENWCRKFID